MPFGAGSTPDLVARILADNLQQNVGSAFVVENKPGASGNTGTDVVAKAEPDGSVIGISLGGPLAINTILFSQLPYDPQKDIAPITLLTAPAERARGADATSASTGRRLRRAAEEGAEQDQLWLDRRRLLSQLCMEAIGLKAGGGKMVHVPYPARRPRSPRCCAATSRPPACRRSR